MKRAAIKYTGSYIPEYEVKNSHVESRLKENGYDVPEGLFAQVMGSETRYYAAETEQASDLAVAASKKVLKQFPKEDVDLLIFAAACGDLIEPATANIVQSKLGLTCPVFDVKNACNSVVNAMQIADAFIQTGQYRNILIASGEKTSDSINTISKITTILKTGLPLIHLVMQDLQLFLLNQIKKGFNIIIKFHMETIGHCVL